MMAVIIVLSVSEASRAATTARWIIHSGRLGQFQLTSNLLYGGEQYRDLRAKG
jgi:hypothetical protein